MSWQFTPYVVPDIISVAISPPYLEKFNCDILLITSTFRSSSERKDLRRMIRHAAQATCFSYHSCT